MNNKYLREELIRQSGVNPRKCMKCGKCSASCPAFSEMDIKPQQTVIRQRGQTHLSPDEIVQLLDPEMPQQLLVSAFRKYRR